MQSLVFYRVAWGVGHFTVQLSAELDLFLDPVRGTIDHGQTGLNPLSV